MTGCFLDCFPQLIRPLLFSGVFFISGSNGSLGYKSLRSNVHLTYTCSFYAYFPSTIAFLTISLIFMAKLKGITFSPYSFLVTAGISWSILLLFFHNLIKLSPSFLLSLLLNHLRYYEPPKIEPHFLH